MQLHWIFCTCNLVSETANVTPVTPSLLKFDIPCSRWYKTGKLYLCEYVCLLHFHLLFLSLSLSLHTHTHTHTHTDILLQSYHTTDDKLQMASKYPPSYLVHCWPNKHYGHLLERKQLCTTSIQLCCLLNY
jgi:hypothetical protein